MKSILFRGTKTFWKTKSSINMVILEYPEHDIYEIIAYDPIMKQHAPRIYVNSLTVKNIICEQRNEVAVEEDVVTTFLFNHLTIVEYLPESRSFTIDICAIFQHERNSIFIVNRPASLPFFRSPFTLDSTGNEEDISMYLTATISQLKLSIHEKWRLPLILLRVSKELPLRQSDAKIWSCFIHNKTQQELLITIANILINSVSNPTRLPTIPIIPNSYLSGRNVTSYSQPTSPCMTVSTTLSRSPRSYIVPAKNPSPALLPIISTPTSPISPLRSDSPTSPVSPQHPLHSPAPTSPISPQYPLRSHAPTSPVSPQHPLHSPMLPPLTPTSNNRINLESSVVNTPIATPPTPAAVLLPRKGYSLDNMWSLFRNRHTLTPLITRSVPSSPHNILNTATVDIHTGNSETIVDSHIYIAHTTHTLNTGNSEGVVDNNMHILSTQNRRQTVMNMRSRLGMEDSLYSNSSSNDSVVQHETVIGQNILERQVTTSATAATTATIGSFSSRNREVNTHTNAIVQSRGEMGFAAGRHSKLPKWVSPLQWYETRNSNSNSSSGTGDTVVAYSCTSK